MWSSTGKALFLCVSVMLAQSGLAHLGSNASPSALVAALSLMAISKVLYGKRVGAAQKRAWFHSLGDADSPGVLGAIWDGGPFLTLP